MPSFLDRLQKEARFFLFARTVFSLVVGFLCWAGLLLLLDLYDAYAPIREADASFWIYWVAGMALLCFFGLLLFSWIRRPSLSNLARKVEGSNPQLKDLLNTAVEIERKDSAPNLMEKRALREMSKASERVDWRTGLGLGSSFWNLIVVGFVCGALLSWWNLDRSPVQKMLDAWTGEEGLVVTSGISSGTEMVELPPSTEIQRGADVSIYAEIIRPHRGRYEAWIETKEREQIVRTPMIPSEKASTMEFILPVVEQPVEYRVVTPSLESEWYNIVPFDPPVLEFATWNFIPPAYMKLDEFTHQGFGYVKVPEGSQISLTVRTENHPPRVGAKLYASDKNHTLNRDGKFTFSWAATLEQDWRAKLSLFDLDHPHRAEVLHDEVVLAPIPDEPPLVEISEPAKDLELAVDSDPLLIDVYANDDFGVSDIRLHVSHDGEKYEEELFVDPVEREKSVTGILDLNNYALAVGDVLTYMAFAVDNKEPEGQIARSEIYFIEILPPEGNSSDSQFEGGDMGQDSKEIPVREFINRTKKIIRDTYDGMLEEGLEMETRSLAISAEALDLKHDMTKVYDEFEGRFPIADGLDLGELLNEATYHIEQTEIYTGDLELEPSLESSEQTLRKLVQLYAFLQEMEKQKAQGQGQQPQDSKGEQGDQQEKQEEQETAQTPSEKLNELAKELEKLNEFEQRQQDINQQVGRSARSGKQGEINQEIAQNQSELRKDVEAFKDQKYNQTGRLGDVADLEEAGNEMKEGAGDLRRDKPHEAQPHGELAAEALGRAKNRIEGEMAQIAADMIDQLTQQANQLGGAQSDLRAETENATGGQGDELKEQQDQLNQSIEELMEDIDQAARGLGKYQERATEDLMQSLQEAKEGGMEKSGRRASNSLLYEGFTQAGKEQQKVEDGLGQLGDRLQAVEDKLRNENNPALANLADHLQRMQEQMGSSGSADLKEMNEEAARSIGNLPQAEEDLRLQNLTQMFEAAAYSEDPNNARSLSAGAVQEATDLIQQFFWQQAMENHLINNQQSTRAPARYRRQVEEYFRRIAEGE